MTGRTEIVSALAVDLGDGHVIKHGDRAGQIRYTGQPTAVFACLICRIQIGPVTGPAAVHRLTARADTHAARCRPAADTTTERHAA